jgi:hypothetical protein
MAVLSPCRGNVYRVNPVEGTGGDRGFYYISALQAKKGDGDALLIMSVNPQESDVVAPIITLENTRILYSFGANFGNISISGMLLLGKSGTPGTSLKTLIDFFEKYRVSKSPTPVEVSGPGAGWNVFFTGLNIGEADSVTNTQAFALTGTIAAPK